MKKLTTNDRLLESITKATNNFSDTNLSETILLDISKKLIDYVPEVPFSEGIKRAISYFKEKLN